jgi:hypothetical protein
MLGGQHPGPTGAPCHLDRDHALAHSQAAGRAPCTPHPRPPPTCHDVRHPCPRPRDSSADPTDLTVQVYSLSSLRSVGRGASGRPRPQPACRTAAPAAPQERVRRVPPSVPRTKCRHACGQQRGDPTLLHARPIHDPFFRVCLSARPSSRSAGVAHAPMPARAATLPPGRPAPARPPSSPSSCHNSLYERV